MNLIFRYSYKNEYNKRKKFEIEATGKTRKELVENLISKRNVVCIYYFLQFFPDLSDEIKEKLKKAIFEIQGINLNTTDSIEKSIEFPEKIYLFTHADVYFKSEKREALYFLHY